jgi:hypothetical protein
LNKPVIMHLNQAFSGIKGPHYDLKHNGTLGWRGCSRG